MEASDTCLYTPNQYYFPNNKSSGGGGKFMDFIIATATIITSALCIIINYKMFSGNSAHINLYSTWI